VSQYKTDGAYLWIFLHGCFVTAPVNGHENWKGKEKRALVAYSPPLSERSDGIHGKKEPCHAF
jgi:hypothetical protein